MLFEFPARVRELEARLRVFMDEHIYPNEKRYHEQIATGDRWQPTAIIEELKPKVAPDLIFTHHRDDRHQDHRLVCELTWNTFRDHTILEYEVPKFDGDFGAPNVFVPLHTDVCERKMSDPSGALDEMLRSFALAPDNPATQEEILRLARATGR